MNSAREKAFNTGAIDAPHKEIASSNTTTTPTQQSAIGAMKSSWVSLRSGGPMLGAPFRG